MAKPGRKPKTEEEKALSNAIKKGADDWQVITEGDITDYSLSEDPYKLPPKAQEMQDKKEFAFRWALADPKRIDELQSLNVPARWWICNRTQPPGLEEYCDSIHGGIKKLDQVLMFKPWWMHEKHQQMKNDLAAIRDAAGDINKKHGKKDQYGEWIAGEDMKITSKDEVMVDTAELSEGG